MDSSNLAIEIESDEVTDSNDPPAGGELEQTQSETKKNPMEITYIIEDVLRHFTVPELQDLRLVSTVWNQDANREIKRKKTVTFVHNEGIDNYMKYFTGSSAYQQRVLSLQHNKFELYQIAFNSLLQFLETHGGEHVKLLSLQQNQSVNESFLHMLLGTFLPQLEWLCVRVPPHAGSGVPCPTQGLARFDSIKSLTLGVRCFREETIMIGDGPEELDQAPPDGQEILDPELDGRQAIRQFTPTPELVRILICLPNLEKLLICQRDTACTADISEGIINTIVAVPPGNLHRLTQLELPLYFNDPLLQNFYDRGFLNLTVVDAKFDNTCGALLVNKFFLMIAKTIRKLKVSFPTNYPITQVVKIPDVMANLEELTIIGYIWPMKFLKYQQNLKHVHAMRSSFNLFPTRIELMNNLRSIRVDGQSFGIDEKILGTITTAFHLLHVLEFPRATNECLRIIYRDLPMLTELILKEGTFNDSGVCGLAEEICDDFIKSFAFNDVKVDLDRFRTDLFVGNLQGIERLVLESDGLRIMSIFSGLVKCGQLQHLQLKSLHLCNESVQILVEGLHKSLKTLNMTECPLVTSEAKVFAKELIPMLDMYIPGDDLPEDPDVLAFNESRVLHSIYTTSLRPYHEPMEEVERRFQAFQGIQVAQRRNLARRRRCVCL